MADFIGIYVVGLQELKRSLKKLDASLPKALNKGVVKAGAAVVSDARRRTPVVSGRAQSSIRIGATAHGAYIAGGKKVVPYFGWLDFGSRKPLSGQPRSVGPWTKSGAGPQGGRILWQAVQAKAPLIRGAVLEAVDESIRTAGLHGR